MKWEYERNMGDKGSKGLRIKRINKYNSGQPDAEHILLSPAFLFTVPLAFIRLFIYKHKT